MRTLPTRTLSSDGKITHESSCVAPRLPAMGRRGRRIDCRVSRGDGTGPDAASPRAPNGRNSRRSQSQEGADPRRRHLGPHRGVRAHAQGLRGAGPRGVVPRRRPQHDAARTADRIDETGFPQVCQFDKDPDLYFNCGPARIPGHHQALLNYCKELDVELEPFINDNRNAWVQDDAMFGGKPIRAREYLNDSRGFVAELMAKSIKKEDLTGADDGGRIGNNCASTSSSSASSIRSSSTSARAARVSRTTTTPSPDVLKKPLEPERAAEVALHADHEFRRDGRPGGDDDGAGRRHGSRRRGIPAQGRAPGAARVAGAVDSRCWIAASRSRTGATAST